jgi:hypothetical protein
MHGAVLLVGMMCLTLVGCVHPQRRVDVQTVSSATTTVLTYPADVRAAYFQGSPPLQWCAEPSPDVALASLQTLTAQVQATLPQAGTQVAAKVATATTAQVLELAGRTQLVMLAREMLYRACELLLNTAGTSQSATDLYREVVVLVGQLGQAVRDQAEAHKVEAYTEQERVRALQQASDTIDDVLRGVPLP